MSEEEIKRGCGGGRKTEKRGPRRETRLDGCEQRIRLGSRPRTEKTQLYYNLIIITYDKLN